MRVLPTLRGQARLWLAGLVLVPLLTGCGGNPDPILAQAVGVNCINIEGPVPAFLCHTRPAGEGEPIVSRYCYASLGEPYCLAAPDPAKAQTLGTSGY